MEAAVEPDMKAMEETEEAAHRVAMYWCPRTRAPPEQMQPVLVRAEAEAGAAQEKLATRQVAPAGLAQEESV